MNIGICGSHRTGKTTLAAAIAKQNQLKFVKTSTSAVFAQHGLDPSEPLDFKTRLWIQHHVIEAAITIWQTESQPFITDRTPIDFMAYTLAEIQGDTEVDYPQLETYINKCFKVCNQYFNKLIIVQPAIPLVYEAGKAALNRAYMEHLNSLIQGLCADERQHCSTILIPRQTLSLEERIDYTKYY
jgi:adenosyl cobinamide kinase/adenosyl cobinamide phosphate guanylyltransferase